MLFNKPSFGHKSYYSAFNGIYKYLQEDEFSILFKDCDNNQKVSKVRKLIREFLKLYNLKCIDNNKETSARVNSNIVAENWNKFKIFLKNKI